MDDALGDKKPAHFRREVTPLQRQLQMPEAVGHLARGREIQCLSNDSAHRWLALSTAARRRQYSSRCERLSSNEYLGFQPVAAVKRSDFGIWRVTSAGRSSAGSIFVVIGFCAIA